MAKYPKLSRSSLGNRLLPLSYTYTKQLIEHSSISAVHVPAGNAQCRWSHQRVCASVSEMCTGQIHTTHHQVADASLCLGNVQQSTPPFLKLVRSLSKSLSRKCAAVDSRSKQQSRQPSLFRKWLQQVSASEMSSRVSRCSRSPEQSSRCISLSEMYRPRRKQQFARIDLSGS
jgi:hypothetical protein